jgi:hypothetical protein
MNDRSPLHGAATPAGAARRVRVAWSAIFTLAAVFVVSILVNLAIAGPARAPLHAGAAVTAPTTDGAPPVAPFVPAGARAWQHRTLLESVAMALFGVMLIGAAALLQRRAHAPLGHRLEERSPQVPSIAAHRVRHASGEPRTPR